MEPIVVGEPQAGDGAAARPLGAKLSFLLWMAIGLLLGGLLVVGGSTALIALAARTRQPQPAPMPPATGRGGGAGWSCSQVRD